MRSILLLSIVLLGLASCQNSTGTDVINDSAKAAHAESDTLNYTRIEWSDPSQQLGTLNFGEKAKIHFHFKNTGIKPLFIISASPSCGCTVADFPKQAIAPGAVGEVVAEFDTNKGHPGNFHKAVSVKANTKETTLHNLVFEGEIKKDGETNNEPPATGGTDTSTINTKKRN